MTDLENENGGGELKYSPEEAGFGMAENFARFVVGENHKFDAYFVQDVVHQKETEDVLATLLGINNDLAPSGSPIVVLSENDVSLFRWSNIVDGQPFDAYYQACRGDEKPSHYYGEVVSG